MNCAKSRRKTKLRSTCPLRKRSSPVGRNKIVRVATRTSVSGKTPSKFAGNSILRYARDGLIPTYLILFSMLKFGHTFEFSAKITLVIQPKALLVLEPSSVTKTSEHSGLPSIETFTALSFASLFTVPKAVDISLY